MFSTEKQSAIDSICRELSVKKLYLFGSCGTARFEQCSDIDVLVEFDELSVEKYTDNFFELHRQLTEILGRKVDLITVNSLTNPYFIQSIEETRKLIYAA